MKILQVNDDYDNRGGAQRYFNSTMSLLGSAGHDNVVLYRRQTRWTIQDDQWPAYRLNTDQRDGVAATLKRLIAIEKPDVVFLHDVASSVVADVAVSMMPAVAYVHAFSMVCAGLAKYFRRGDEVCTRAFGWGCVPMHYLRRCSAARRPTTIARLVQDTASRMRAFRRIPQLLVASQYMRALLLQNGFTQEQTTLLPPHFIMPAERRQFLPPEDPFLLVYAGRLEIEKGLPYLLEALRSLPLPIHLIVAGDGTLRSSYEDLASHLNIAERVEFIGWRNSEELSDLYLRSAAVIMPSLFPEPFGKVGVEALAHGRPVVAFNVGGISDWLIDGVNGYLAEPASADDLAYKIKSLLCDSDSAREKGIAAQRFAADRFAAADHLETLVATFERALQAGVRDAI